MNQCGGPVDGYKGIPCVDGSPTRVVMLPLQIGTGSTTSISRLRKKLDLKLEESVH